MPFQEPSSPNYWPPCPRMEKLMVYGALSEKEMMIPHGRFIFEGKKISGFWLSQWINQQSMFTLLQAFNKVQKFLCTEHEIQIRDRMSLTQVIEGLNTFSRKYVCRKNSSQTMAAIIFMIH